MAENIVGDTDLVAQARSRVARRRAAGGYPDDLVNQVERTFESDSAAYATAPEALAHIPSGRPLHSGSPWGALTIPAKRVLRRMLSWYVHPITVDQSRFNAAIVAELRRLEARIDRLEADAHDTPKPRERKG